MLQRDTGATASVVRDWGRSFFRQLCWSGAALRQSVRVRNINRQH